MKRPLSTIQTLTGSSRSEAIVVLILLSGLLIGYGLDLWRRASRSPWEDSVVAADIARMLDSTAKRTAVADSVHVLTSSASIVSARTQAPHPVNVNTASVGELTSLPGVGERTAERIVERRSVRRFLTPEDIMDVKGIGQKKFERMRPFLRVQ